ncbi:hypothetical protein GCM10010885_06750 [Alicyclobacillus cellulosilyticus]|uniref:DUF2264 domain-containing protein n=1 Tax=Alicyclobacillus cellulosilyticus TaxID=1003997 RepID=A0A917NGU2_9BACL|nr:DUF2264 domain-containing protein [Alicyclobacillus cellulosilyticus]GGJ00155.1 hypothetical protein GCM10010885_06750 [Alicyclobacillus cellulosilyticus]
MPHPSSPGLTERSLWLDTLLRIIHPVLSALAARELKRRMPVEARERDRARYTHLEAFSRTLVGTAPWLELHGLTGDEEERRQHYAALAREALDAATDPGSPDFMNFTEGGQPIVDTAFLAQAILRAPTELWHKLTPRVQGQIIACLQATRYGRKPPFNNWLLFSAMIETALHFMGQDWDQVRVDYALRQFEQWYVGDGAYGDGPSFHWDYYNSFVIHPMLVDITLRMAHHHPDWAALREPILRRAQRYAAVLERLIGPDGSYPPLGRSITYRLGAFHALAQMALLRLLPPEVTPAQVRCALTAVLQRTLHAPGTFDQDGWLRIGLCGHQPGLAEGYISTGSLYLCTTGLLPLGLPPDDPFWAHPPVPWTAKALWNGADLQADHALAE